MQVSILFYGTLENERLTGSLLHGKGEIALHIYLSAQWLYRLWRSFKCHRTAQSTTALVLVDEHDDAGLLSR